MKPLPTGATKSGRQWNEASWQLISVFTDSLPSGNSDSSVTSLPLNDEQNQLTSMNNCHSAWNGMKRSGLFCQVSAFGYFLYIIYFLNLLDKKTNHLLRVYPSLI